MDEFPNAEDEYEMLHADEFEMMREFDNFDEDAAAAEAATIPPSIKRSLNFASPPSVAVKNTTVDEGIAEMTQLHEIQNDGLMNRKRPADRAFDDDLDQFLNDDFMENKKKKQKPLLPNVGKSNNPQDIAKHEADLDLINRILETRKGLQRPELSDAVQTINVCERPKHEARIYKRLPDGAFQAITTETGERYYLTKIEEDEWDSQVNSITASHKANCLLNIPYIQLKAQAEQEQIRQDARRARSLQEAEDSGMESGVEDEEVVKDTLWVEKYKPKYYLDLLSDESTNRTVLHWVKLWDKLVFGTEKKQKVKEEKKSTQTAKPFNKFQKKGPEVIEELDEQNRPMQKVILLCGPPGLGKTTLAHVIAKHAGYNVVEMNASDDRSVETFRTNLENATSMKSVLGPDPRPNCLIIDEIDGAPAPSITLLVNMLLGKDTGGKNRKGKKKEVSAMLQRPVICICNELYTPALRPLRQISLVIQFPPTHSSRLAQRLLEISRKHRLRADLTVLMALCDKTENDIRSCLAFLQFVRSTKNTLRLNDIDGAALGQKDYQRSLFSVWHDIFTIPRPKKKRRGNPHEQQHENGVLLAMPDLNCDLDNFGEETTLSARFSRMLRTVQSCGEYDKLTQGWFENYPAMKIKNAAMEPVTNGLEWAAFTDIVQKEIMHSQAWTMMGFLPYACVSYHLQFASYQWPKIQFPNQMSELIQKLGKMQNLVIAMVNEMRPLTRVFAGANSLIRDVLPYLLQIIQPNLRPVNTQLYSRQEKEELANLIDTMISYNLTYTQERSIDGQYSFNLDPNMEELVRFPDQKTGKQLSYATRQLIAREIDLEKVRRAEAYFVKQQETEAIRKEKSGKENQAPKMKQANSSSSVPTPDSAALPNHLQKLQAKPVLEPSAVKDECNSDAGRVAAPKDFFGRVISNAVHQEAKSMTNEIVKSDIWFRFKEGYSNAVRRPIKLKDLV
ncbi:chromosome transmission fidelity protein 18 homolog isoform X1 [Penaeus chinensis]|uniref:chromosome transmission fidelity protein 18 homolog isoform X1 n=2 Tax=Penaeus chinensis TaxID=139456 RepID=UPI001FB5D7FE|nr:chromosome transmission fidelity protein 18 homolog isoform X1 [Penaeus chinensis]